MNDMIQFSMARKALKKLHPSWLLFIDEVMDLLQPFWLGIQSREEVHFIHLIGYGKRQKAREILTDLLELLDWQSESIILWQNWDNPPWPFDQAVSFQEAYRIFPKVVLTDFLSDFFISLSFEREECPDFVRVQKFLKERKELQLTDLQVPASDARGSLIISFMDSIGDSDHVRTRMILQFLWEKPIQTMGQMRKSFVPEDALTLIEKGYLQRKELVFFSKDDSIQILLAFELQKITQVLEEKGTELLGTPLKLTFLAMDYFLAYIFYRRLSSLQLRRAAIDFFLPVFRQYPRITQKADINFIQLDFRGGWKFTVIKH